MELDADTPFSLCVTGSNTEALLEQAPDIPSFGDIPAVVEGVRQIVPQLVRSLKSAVRVRDSSRICRAVHRSSQSTNTVQAARLVL